MKFQHLQKHHPISEDHKQASKQENEFITSSYFCVKVRRSSSDISGRSTTIVSYLRRPGGHCGSSLSSTSGKPEPGIVGGGASLPSKSLSKKARSNSALAAEAVLGLPRRCGALILMGLLEMKREREGGGEWGRVRGGFETMRAHEGAEAIEAGEDVCCDFE